MTVQKYLIKDTIEYRVESLPEVEDFHKELQKEASDGGYTLSGFSWTEKYVKEKGDIVDSYYDVKATFWFNDIKEPQFPEFSSVIYTGSGE